MILNNNGWGLKEMIIYSCILLFFLLVAVFMIIRLNHGIGENVKDTVQSGKDNPVNEVKPKTYNEMEKEVRNAAIVYINTYYTKGLDMDTIVVNVDNLIVNELITELKDEKDNSKCSGYALVNLTEDNKINSESFIKCKNYQTENYQDWRID